jgi:hypothetical protein
MFLVYNTYKTTASKLNKSERKTKMSEIIIGDVYKVEVIESERGWGSKIDEVKYFNTKEFAEKFVKEFNSANDKDVVPDWYMYAQYCGKIQ